MKGKNNLKYVIMKLYFLKEMMFIPSEKLD